MDRFNVISLIFSLILALLFSLLLNGYDEIQIRDSTFPDALNITDLLTEFELSLTTSSTHFHSQAEFYSRLYSPDIKFLTIEISLDKVYWKPVVVTNILSTQDNLEGGFTKIGYLDLLKTNHVIYGRIKSPQDFGLREGISKKEALNNIQGKNIIKPIRTSRENILLLLTFFVFFSFFYQIFLALK